MSATTDKSRRNMRCKRMLRMVNGDSDRKSGIPDAKNDTINISSCHSTLDSCVVTNFAKKTSETEHSPNIKTKLVSNDSISISLTNTPKSLRLNNINFIASPTILFALNNTDLSEISNIESSLNNLDQSQNESTVPMQQLNINTATTEGHSPSLISFNEGSNGSRHEALDVNNEVTNNFVDPLIFINQNSNPLFVKPLTDNTNFEFFICHDLETSYEELPMSDVILHMDTQLIVSDHSESLQKQTQKEIESNDSAPEISSVVLLNDQPNEPIVEHQNNLNVHSEEGPRLFEEDNVSDGAASQERNVSNEEFESSEKTQITPTRKRLRNEKNWKDNKNKRLKNAGKAYQGVRNKKNREEKKMGETCSCKRKCSEKIDENTREKIFKVYWGLADHEKQWDYILKNISTNSIKRMQLVRKLNRTQTIIYKLPHNNDDNKADKVVVCKNMFLKTLGITEKVVYTAIEKNNSDMKDKRGTHLNRPKKMSEQTEKSIIDHIKEFPVIESHYTRKSSKRLYLQETLNQSKMYRLYKEWYILKPEYEIDKMASKSQYETILNTRFNYSFFRPKKDMCDQCSIFHNADTERKAQLQEDFNKHREEKETVRKIKEKEKSDFDKSTKIVACFDLEKVLHIPQSEMSSFYYKRKYPVYNFTIYNILTKSGYCFVWHYQIAKRGAIEIASCLYYYIKQEAENGKQTISFYSDSCTGQNRNRFVFAMFQYATKIFSIDITHRFFVKGHSQSEGDMMHSCIEKAKKRHTIYTPDQMYCIIDNAKVTGEKFHTKEMQQSDFYDFKKLVTDKAKNWFQDDASNKIYWSKVREVKSDKNCPDKLFYKYSIEEEYKSITTTRPVSRRRRNNDGFTLQMAYNQLISVPKPLYNDLISLCNTEAIPIQYQQFYRNLTPHNQSSDIANNQLSDSEDEE